MREKQHLPIYGVGPFYGAGVFILTAVGVLLSLTGVIDSGRITSAAVTAAFIIVGIALIAAGIAVWYPAAFGRKRIDGYIETNKLCTTGIYAWVRNPCYSGIMIFCTGILLTAHNLWLLILPPIFWVAMTVLMINSEEKWLEKLYGQEYIDYKKRVNRCIPWFPKRER